MSGNNNTDWGEIALYVCIAAVIIVGILAGK